jgi:hypothetical protein
MKNVAATNGQSVSFAALVFGLEITWEGIWAGTDMLLNLYSRPPWAKFALDAAGEQTCKRRIQVLHRYATKKFALSEKNYVAGCQQNRPGHSPWATAGRSGRWFSCDRLTAVPFFF